MCRIIGLFLLIKINKQTTREQNNRVFCHGSYIYVMRPLTVRNSATCPNNDNKLLMLCVVLHVTD